MTIYTLSDSDIYIHLLLHAHQHYFSPKTLIDLCACFDTLEPDTERLKQYKLTRLYKCMLSALSSFIDNTYFEYSHDEFGKLQIIVSSLCRVYLKNILTDVRGGGMIFGDTSAVSVASGVLIRAFSMALLDGYIYPLRAAMDVLLLGPHRVGRLLSSVIS